MSASMLGLLLMTVHLVWHCQGLLTPYNGAAGVIGLPAPDTDNSHNWLGGVKPNYGGVTINDNGKIGAQTECYGDNFGEHECNRIQFYWNFWVNKTLASGDDRRQHTCATLCPDAMQEYYQRQMAKHNIGPEGKLSECQNADGVCLAYRSADESQSVISPLDGTVTEIRCNCQITMTFLRNLNPKKSRTMLDTDKTEVRLCDRCQLQNRLQKAFFPKWTIEKQSISVQGVHCDHQSHSCVCDTSTGIPLTGKKCPDLIG